MKNYDFGMNSPNQKRLKTSISLRPKSQQPRMSIQSSSSPPFSLAQESQQHPSFQPNTSINQYYIQSNSKSKRELSSSNQQIPAFQETEIEKFNKWKRSFYDKMERSIGGLRDQIFKQSSTIMNLQRAIQRQQRDIQKKNQVIQALTGKKEKGERKVERKEGLHEAFLIKKMTDLELKVQLLTSQLAEQKQEISSKIDKLGVQLLQRFGKKLSDMRSILEVFILSKDKQLNQMEGFISKLTQNSQIQLFYRNSPQATKNDLKNSSEGSVRDTCSSVNTKSSLHSQKVIQKKRKDESTYSDYFFHPVQPEPSTPTNISALQELVRDREQLPIRVFVDNCGRLKYWQSRTYIFDRRGNFTIPTSSQLLHMQQKGWLKVIAE